MHLYLSDAFNALSDDEQRDLLIDKFILEPTLSQEDASGEGGSQPPPAASSQPPSQRQNADTSKKLYRKCDDKICYLEVIFAQSQEFKNKFKL